MTSVLVVDDERQIRRALSLNFSARGYTVTEAGSGEAALSQIADDRPDIVLLDLGLPGMNGISVIEALRGWTNVPIIVLTAREDERSKVLALEAGADDYVTKPFVTKELLARIRAQIRRANEDASDHGLLECGEVRLRPDTAEVQVGTRVVPLSPTEYKLLAELIGARERVVSRDDLLRNVWGYRNPGDGRVVDNLVYRLRAKMEADPAEPAHLLTVRGFGYRLKA